MACCSHSYAQKIKGKTPQNDSLEALREAARQQIINQTNVEALDSLSSKWKAKEESEKAIAHKIAREKGWPIRKVDASGKIVELMRIDAQGRPVYYTTDSKTSESEGQNGRTENRKNKQRKEGGELLIEESHDETINQNLSPLSDIHLHSYASAPSVYLEIEGDYAGIVQAELFTIDGNLLTTLSWEKETKPLYQKIDLSGQAASMYLLRVQSSEGESLFKLLKQ